MKMQGASTVVVHTVLVFMVNAESCSPMNASSCVWLTGKELKEYHHQRYIAIITNRYFNASGCIILCNECFQTADFDDDDVQICELYEHFRLLTSICTTVVETKAPIAASLEVAATFSCNCTANCLQCSNLSIASHNFSFNENKYMCLLKNYFYNSSYDGPSNVSMNNRLCCCECWRGATSERISLLLVILPASLLVFLACIGIALGIRECRRSHAPRLDQRLPGYTAGREENAVNLSEHRALVREELVTDSII